MNDDTNNGTASDYYDGGFRRVIGGVPCKVYSRRLTDGRIINAKGSAGFNPLYDDAKHGISRLEKDADVIEAARGALAARMAKKPRKGAAKPVERVQPVLATYEPSEHVTALEQRLAALESMVRGLGLAVGGAKPVAANDDAAPPRRTECERAAIVRAWRMRCEMRERADLDRRALLQVNGDNRLLHETLRTAERERDMLRDQHANARRAATDWRTEAETATVRADRAENDLAGARAEAAALVRRLDQSRAAAVTRRALPMPPPVVSKLPRVLVGAR